MGSEACCSRLPSGHFAGSPFEVGEAIGRSFQSLIASRFQQDAVLHSQLLPFVQTEVGQKLLEHLSATNRTRYPSYWQELEGLAAGSKVPLQEVVVMNMRKELSLLRQSSEKAEAASASNDCSDVLLCSKEAALVGHNEDGAASARGHMYMVHVKLETGLRFSGYCYAGELPSSAFGFNSAGMAFSLDAVNPQEVDSSGIARNFVARDLQEASNMEDALLRVTNVNFAVGHHYNLMDVVNRRIVSVEAASSGRFSVLEVREKAYFHANHYLRIDIPQLIPASTRARQLRMEAMCSPSNASDVLGVLSDEDDADCPIFMTGPCNHTLCTALFDLDNKKLTVFTGRATEGNVIASYALGE